MKIYNLEQYREIQQNSISYVLPEMVMNIIQHLTKDLGILNMPTPPPPSSSSSSSHSSTYGIGRSSSTGSLLGGGGGGGGGGDYLQSSSKYRRNGNIKPDYYANPDKTWEKVKPFKTTVIDKKEGIDKRINEIRICLNKISNKNYDVQKESIIQSMEGIQSDMDDDEEEELIKTAQLKVATAIFDIASTNKFYSALYAILYKELNDRFSIFREILGGFIEDYLKNIQSIEYVDSNTDYDKYCLNNKENDKRKAMSVFIVNLMKNGILEKERVLHIIKQVQEMVLKYIETPGKLNEVEEITENIFLFITTAKDDFDYTKDGEWKTLLENVKKCSKMKSKEHASLSSRAVFKYMDILALYPGFAKLP
jgi:hypothetical protein